MTSQDWDRRYEDSGAVSHTVQPHPRLAEEAARLEPGRAVEVGCGEGRQAIWLAGRGWNVTAVDFSPVAVERGRAVARHHGADVDWVVTDVVDYRPPAGIDLAVVMYLHIHPATLAGVLDRLAEALAPGGTLFVLGWDRGTHGGGPGSARTLYDPDDLAAAVGSLRTVRAERVPQAGSDTAVDTLLTATRPAWS